MKELFERSSVDAGVDGTEEHGVFDAEPLAFGVLAKEGGGEVHKLQKAMFDTIRTLQMKAVRKRAEELHQDDARRWPTLQSAQCPTANTLANTNIQRVDFNLPEEFQTAVQCNQAAPVSALEPLRGLPLQTPNSRDVSTRVDPYASNMFMGSLKEKDADGVTRTKSVGAI